MLLAIVLCMSCSACGQVDKNRPTEASTQNTVLKETTEFELSTSNVGQYLSFDVSYSDVEKKEIAALGKQYFTTTMSVKMYSIQSVSFSNVKLKLEVSCPSDWWVSSSDPSYKETDKNIAYIDINLPADGSYSKQVDLSTLYTGTVKNDARVKVVSVSGTVTKK